MGPNPLSPRAYTITSYALCGFANLGSMGIQIGVLSALAPSRGKSIAHLATSGLSNDLWLFLHVANCRYRVSEIYSLVDLWLTFYVSLEGCLCKMYMQSAYFLSTTSSSIQKSTFCKIKESCITNISGTI